MIESNDAAKSATGFFGLEPAYQSSATYSRTDYYIFGIDLDSMNDKRRYIH
jgi:hypothetical protein